MKKCSFTEKIEVKSTHNNNILAFIRICHFLLLSFVEQYVTWLGLNRARAVFIPRVSLGTPGGLRAFGDSLHRGPGGVLG